MNFFPTEDKKIWGKKQTKRNEMKKAEECVGQKREFTFFLSSNKKRKEKKKNTSNNTIKSCIEKWKSKFFHSSHISINTCQEETDDRK